MGHFARFRNAPASTSGRIRHDPLMGFADVAVAGLFGLSGAIRNVAPLPSVARDFPLVVTDRRVVAHDQDVIALTFAAPHGGPLPRWHPRSTHRRPPAQRQGAAVLAVRRSGYHQ
jgi:hypothetical protein